jgi:succinate-semialdehyde dehydrogenase/glutarate-semialdehyde dehydrogenase
MAMTSINPATGEAFGEFPTLSKAEVEAKLAKAAATFRDFSPRRRLAERTVWLGKAADILERDKAKWAKLMTLEMGKPIAQSEAEIEKCAGGCRHYAAHAEAYLADSHDKTGRAGAYVRWLPIGPILAVMPWNFPFWQVFRFAAPALAAGNVGLLKHASNVPQCALAIEEIFREAGFPDGAFQTLLIPSSMVEGVIADHRVRAATLTGSEGAGSQVAAAAGKHLKKTVLELGGSDPFIVMPSADLDKAIATAVKARIQNTGQSCIAAKRFIVHADIYDRFAAGFVAAMKALSYGDPMDRANAIGPLATVVIRDELAKQVDDTIAAGGKCLLGGKTPDKKAPGGKGAFYPATVLADIPENSPAYLDELFGPVASLFRVRDIDEAIRIANATRFGLGSNVWTNDAKETARFVDEIEAGFTAVNGMTASDSRLPFGGVKSSGYGRELSDLGMHEFLNAKTVANG